MFSGGGSGSSSVSGIIWHRRLGHPASRVTSHVLDTTGSVITLPRPITQDPQATMAPPPSAAVTDTLADVGTTYATADTRVAANYYDVLSDVTSIPLLLRVPFILW